MLEIVTVHLKRKVVFLLDTEQILNRSDFVTFSTRSCTTSGNYAFILSELKNFFISTRGASFTRGGVGGGGGGGGSTADVRSCSGKDLWHVDSPDSRVFASNIRRFVCYLVKTFLAKGPGITGTPGQHPSPHPPN